MRPTPRTLLNTRLSPLRAPLLRSPLPHHRHHKPPPGPVLNGSIYGFASITTILALASIVYGGAASAEVVEVEAKGGAGKTKEEMKRRARESAVVGKMEGGRDDELYTFAWGNNTNATLSPSPPGLVKTPKPLLALSGPGVALRDVTLTPTYGAAVDAKGDVYLWGKSVGADEEGALRKCLVGLDITSLASTKSKLYALSSSGTVYCLPTLSTLLTPSDFTPYSTLPNAPKSSLLVSILDPFHLFHSPSLPKQAVDYTPLDVATQSTLGFPRSATTPEKVTSIKTGGSHLLALTNHGRVLAHAVSPAANSHRQLADLDSIVLPRPSHPTTQRALEDRNNIHLLESAIIPNYAQQARLKVSERLDPLLIQYLGNGPKEDFGQAKIEADRIARDQERLKREGGMVTKRGLRPEEDIWWSTTLYEIPVLEGLKVDQIAAGANSSYVRVGGKVLGFGANEYNQIGLPPGSNIDNVYSPTEIILAPLSASGKQTTTCTDVHACGNTAFFTVRRAPLNAESWATSANGGGSQEVIDLMAAGNGVYGALGNGGWSNVSSGVVRVKSVSGQLEYDEALNRQVPLAIHSMTSSPSGSIFCTLASSASTPVPPSRILSASQPPVYGRDLLVWGTNAGASLGNGRRANLAIPQHLPPLPNPSATPAAVQPTSQKVVASSGAVVGEVDVKPEESMSSGTASPMPHKRLQLMEGRTVVRDLEGKEVSRKKGGGERMVEQTVVAGEECGLVYWKVVPE